MTTVAKWYTVREMADRLRLRPHTVWLILQSYRDQCRLGRKGSHPRKLLWIPIEVVRAIEKQRKSLGR